MKEPARRILPPLVVAAADIGVGSLLYHQVSAPLGLLLLVCGLGVLVTLASGSLNLVGSALWRRLSEEAAGR